MSKVTILQLNMGRRRIVADELRSLTQRYDIVAVQEPSCRGNKVTGFVLTSRVIVLSSGEICSDTNSWNTVLGSNRTNRRGVKLGEFIVRSQLAVMNDFSAIPTFFSVVEQSWIDVTLASPPLTNRIIDWTLRSETSSDHQAIFFRLMENTESSHGIKKGYVTRRANWRTFRSTLEEKLVDNEWDAGETNKTDDLDYRVPRITGIMCDTAEDSLQPRKAKARPVPSWTPGLTTMKTRWLYQKCSCDEAHYTS